MTPLQSGTHQRGAGIDDAALPLCLRLGMLAQFAAGGAVVPFITLLMRDRGLDLAQTSLIFSSCSATLLVFPFLWGMLADRVLPLNRLFTVLNVGAGLALCFFLAQRNFTGWLLSYTAFFACFNPTLYLINALSFHHLPNPPRQFGRLRAWGSLGWTLPFLPISLWLARDPGTDLDFALYLGIACCVAMAGVSLWLPHTAPGARSRARTDAADPHARRGPVRKNVYGHALRILVTEPNYVVLLVSMFLMAGSFSLLTYYSPAMLQDAGVPRPWIGPVQAIGVLFEVALFQWQPALVRRWKFSAVILAGCLCLAIRQLLFGLVANAWILAGSYLLAGAVVVFYIQGVSLLVNALAAPEVRATAQTLLLFFGQGLGPLFANAVTHRLARSFGFDLRATFLFAAGLAALASVTIALRGRRLNVASLRTQCLPAQPRHANASDPLPQAVQE